jgi:V/A-type H+-transporting ATPase subunit K
MYYLLAMVTLIVLGTIASGVYLTIQPAAMPSPQRVRHTVLFNIAIFCMAVLALMVLGINDVMAQVESHGGMKEITVGLGLALIGIGLPTCAATIAAGIAVGPVASAALAVIVEKPEIFGRSLVYLGLAEGIAIYGLVISILLLGQI